jgi:hypothetical protein
MSGNNNQRDGQDLMINRRTILKNAAILGTLSVTAPRVGASPAEKSVELDSILSLSKVEKLTSEIRGLELDRDNATVFGTDGSLVVVPSNYGKLLTTIPDSIGSDSDPTDNEVAASFYFDEWVPGVDDAWPQGTEARLTVTDDELLLQRSATDAETRQLSAAINRPDFRGDNTNITVTPERGDVSFTHINPDKREIETVTAIAQERSVGLTQQQGAAETDHTEVELQVINTTTYTDSEISAAAGCNGDIIFNLAYCMFDYADCVLCTWGSPVPPVLVACVIIVCFDGGVAFAVEYFADFGCFSAGKGIYSCVQNVVDEYADDIPI